MTAESTVANWAKPQMLDCPFRLLSEMQLSLRRYKLWAMENGREGRMG
jgi:hypothetical protein